MRRVTRQELRDIVDRLQRFGADISIGWAYGQPRCYNKQGNIDLSPRLPTGQMALWLSAFEHGLNHEKFKEYSVMMNTKEA